MFLQRECLSPFSQNGRIRKPKRREKGNKRSIYNETQKNPLFTKTNVYEETFPSHALGLRILRSRCAGDDFGNERHGADADGQPLAGATVIAVHTPSGTQYGAVSDKNGG